MAQFQPYKVSGAYRAQVALNAKWTNVDGWRLPESFGSRRGRGQPRAAWRWPAGRERPRQAGSQGHRPRRARRGLRTARRSRARYSGRSRDTPSSCPHPRPAPYATPSKPSSRSRRGACTSPMCPRDWPCSRWLVRPARDVLAGLTSIDLRPKSFGNEASAPCTLAHVHATIYRGDWGSLRAYLLIVNREAAEHVWTTIHHAGHKHGLTPSASPPSGCCTISRQRRAARAGRRRQRNLSRALAGIFQR